MQSFLDGLCFVIVQMENTEKRSEEEKSTACADLENILQKLETMSNDMDQLACMYHTESNSQSLTVKPNIFIKGRQS